MAIVQWISIVLLLFNTVCQTISTAIKYDNQFFPHTLQDKSDFEYFFTAFLDDRLYYAVAKLKYCPDDYGPVKFSLAECNNLYRVDDVVQRQKYYYMRAVVYRFMGAEGVETVSSLKSLLKFFNTDHLYLAMTVAKGPFGQQQSSPADKLVQLEDDYTGVHHNYVLMFSEGKDSHSSNAGEYTADQLRSIAQECNQSYMKDKKVSIMLDTYHLSRTNLDDMKQAVHSFKCFKSVFLYEIEDQQKPNLLELKKRVQLLTESVSRFIFLMQDDIRTKLFSYAPYVEWRYIHIDRHERADRFDDFKMDDFFQNPRAMRIFEVQDCYGDLIVGGSCKYHPYPLSNIIFPLEKDERVIVLDFVTPRSLQVVTFDYRTKPFVMLTVLPGPNSEKEIIPLDQVMNEGLNAIYVLGFDEAVGDIKHYQSSHVSALAELVAGIRLKSVGIRLNVEFLKEQQQPGFFSALCNQDAYQYLFLMEECCLKTYTSAERGAIKYNLNMLCHRTTYLFVDEGLAEIIYKDESFRDPEPPKSFNTTLETDAPTPVTTNRDPYATPNMTFPSVDAFDTSIVMAPSRIVIVFISFSLLYYFQ